MAKQLPPEARVVVIGGGIMGCSTAYHLSKMGCEDVVLLERKQLTSGTTWHSAAQVRQLRSSANMTRLIKNSVALYESLEEETGQATGWIQKGSLSLATNPDRLTHIKRQAALAGLFGVEADVISGEEAGRHWPLVRTDDVIGAVFSPDDGRVNPSDVCAALIKGAKSRGVSVFEDCQVTAIEKRNGRVSAVVTEQGRIECQAVALCAGLWSREVAALAGVTAPLYACEHFFLLTEDMEGITGHLPTLSDHDGYLYIRDEVGGLLVGCFEPDAKPLPMDKLPKDFAFDFLNEDWDHFEPMLMNAMHRIPALETAEARMLLNGPESFTPDGQFMLGESPELNGFFLGCGMNSVGVASGGGAGKALAEWILEGRPTMDLWEVDVRRFAPFQNNLRALHDRIPEELGLHYAISFPGRQKETVRNLRLTPVHQRLVENGAHFAERAGWERPEFFVPAGETIEETLTFARPAWFDRVGAECRAAIDGVVMIDQSSFSKLMIQGRDAKDQLQRLCSNNIDVAPGRIVYTAFLNDRGGVQSDFTVMRLDEDAFLVVTGTGMATKDLAWIRRNLDTDANVTITDVTSAYAVIGVAGPKSRELMSRVTPEDVSARGFPFYTHREMDVGFARVRAARLSYTGELGWELYVPAEFAVSVYDSLKEAGADLGIVDLGTRALTSLRIEKGFRAWGHDVTAADSADEGGIGFVVKTAKEADFLGKSAILEGRKGELSRRLVFLVLDDVDANPLGGEPIVHCGEPVGQVTSAAFGYRLGKPVCMGYVERPKSEVERMITEGGIGVDIACEVFSAACSFDPPA